jgi:hypothetical protein
VGKKRHLEAVKCGRREGCKRTFIENGAEEPTNSDDNLQKSIFTKGVIVANSSANGCLVSNMIKVFLSWV